MREEKFLALPSSLQVGRPPPLLRYLRAFLFTLYCFPFSRAARIKGLLGNISKGGLMRPPTPTRPPLIAPPPLLVRLQWHA